jgi:hypothetical protein
MIARTSPPARTGPPVRTRPGLKAPGYATAPAEAGLRNDAALLLRPLEGPSLRSPAASARGGRGRKRALHPPGPKGAGLRHSAGRGRLKKPVRPCS